MLKNAQSTRTTSRAIIYPSEYPFTARDLLEDFWALLSRNAKPLEVDILARMAGIPISTSYWFGEARLQQMVAFLKLLERLSPALRHAYIEAHCRLFPTFEHPWLVQAPSKERKLRRLLAQKQGLTLITGANDFTRTLFVAACGHSLFAEDQQTLVVAGIDLHRPYHFVPVNTMTYIDNEAELPKIRKAATNIWARLATSAARVLILNRVWSSLPELRDKILRCSRLKHVVIADERISDEPSFVKEVVAPRVLILTGGVPGRRRVCVHFSHATSRR